MRTVPNNKLRSWIASLTLAMTVCFMTSCAPMQKPKSEVAQELETQAITELQQGKFETAKEKLNKVLKESPHRWRSLNALGILQSLRDESQQAQASFAAANIASPDNPAILNNWGLALAMDNRYDEAIARLMQAIEVAPEQARAQPEMNLALVYALSGNEKSAEVALRRYMEPDTIKENLKFYRSLRKDSQKSRQLLQDAYGMPMAEEIPQPTP